jgi:hypothetical protein
MLKLIPMLFHKPIRAHIVRPSSTDMIAKERIANIICFLSSKYASAANGIFRSQKMKMKIKI